MLQSEAAGSADITTVATLLTYARDANYFSSVVLKGPDQTPPATRAVDLTASAAVATVKETADAIKNPPKDKPPIDPTPIDPAPVVPAQELPPLF